MIKYDKMVLRADLNSKMQYFFKNRASNSVQTSNVTDEDFLIPYKHQT